MRNRKIVKIQLIALAILTALVVGRVWIGSGEPDGLVVMTDLDEAELRRATVKLNAISAFTVEATGSLEEKFDPDGPIPALAAYPWILNRDTREVVWQMSPANVQVERTTLVHSATTLTLPAGTYDIFFTTYGNSRESRKKGNVITSLFKTHWTSDSDSWQLIMRLAGDADAASAVVSSDHQEDLAPRGEGILWTSAPMPNYLKKQYVFTVDQPGTIRTYALGEICEREECDYGWVEEVFSGTRVWELTGLNSTAAGGMATNRMSNQDVELPPGMYRAVFRTDRRHAWGKWIANPPLDPAGWGMTLQTGVGEGATIGARTFDPWTDLTPVIRISHVGNDERRQVQFEVSTPTDVVLAAVGEITGSGSLYDCAWLRNDKTGEQIWEMSYANSFSAGGASKNRQEVAFIKLPAGLYSVFYETDDSHAFDSWNSPKPTHPDRWGVALFELGDAPTIRLSERAAPVVAPRVPPAPASPPADVPPLGTGEVIADARGIRSESDVALPISLTSPARLHVVALGEISMIGRYDYAWIENRDGATVWEMSYENTIPEQSNDAYRKFDGIIELPSGSYVVRFTTDFSRAYGDFGNEAPAEPEAWGVVVERLPAE